MPPRRKRAMLASTCKAGHDSGRQVSERAKRAMIRAKKKDEQQEGVDDQSSVAGAYLYEHLLQQIFLRMPTKPLVQLKCLSKHWKRQISDPNFMKLRPRRRIFLPSLPFHAIDNTGAPSMIKLFFPDIIYPEWYKDMTIVGSFNGILLLVLKQKNPVIDHIVFREDMILYNPFSGRFMTVPPSQSFDPYSNYVYGFGYGTTTHDLKIVRLKEKSSGDSKSCEVFSFKTWSWSRPSKSIKLIGDYLVSNSYSGIFANGFLYWNAVRTTHFRPSFILALDMNKMIFSEIEIADGRCFLRLGIYKGRLCMLRSQINFEGFELRVMNEHGFGKSWSTICSFTSPYTMQISYAAALGMLCILDDGKLLMLQPSEQRFIIYDMLEDSYIYVKTLENFVLRGRLQSLEYVESSISPSNICSVSI